MKNGSYLRKDRDPEVGERTRRRALYLALAILLLPALCWVVMLPVTSLAQVAPGLRWVGDYEEGKLEEG